MTDLPEDAAAKRVRDPDAPSHDSHNRLSGLFVQTVLKEAILAMPTRKVLVLVESCVLAVLLAVVRPDQREAAADLLATGVKQRLAKIALEDSGATRGRA